MGVFGWIADRGENVAHGVSGAFHGAQHLAHGAVDLVEDAAHDVTNVADAIAHEADELVDDVEHGAEWVFHQGVHGVVAIGHGAKAAIAFASRYLINMELMYQTRDLFKQAAEEYDAIGKSMAAAPATFDLPSELRRSVALQLDTEGRAFRGYASVLREEAGELSHRANVAAAKSALVGITGIVVALAAPEAIALLAGGGGEVAAETALLLSGEAAAGEAGAITIQTVWGTVVLGGSAVLARGAQAAATLGETGEALVVETGELSAADAAVLSRAQLVWQSAELAELRAAHLAGVASEVQIGGAPVLYSPNAPTVGMSLFNSNGFLLGPEAFSSDEELAKTILHELYRLETSLAADGVSAELVGPETKAAVDFANRFHYLFPPNP